MREPTLSAPSTSVRFLNWGARLGGLLCWLVVGLIPLSFDFFGVLPLLGMTDPASGTPDAFAPAEAAGYTLYWLVVATGIYQLVVIPEARLDATEGSLVVRGPLFTTTVPLAALDSVRIGPGVPLLASAGRSIPVYALTAPNLPEFGPFRRRLQKAFRAAVLAARDVPAPSEASNAPARTITGLSKPQVAMAIVNVAYAVYGLLSTTR